MDYHLLTCIVERGRAERIADEAIRAGAQGATIFPARGKGVRERLGPAGGLIDPEKEVILIVTRKEETQRVFDIVVKAAHLGEPGRGFAYLQPVQQAVGFLNASSASGIR
jgi:nitrogen regulatory protein PII